METVIPRRQSPDIISTRSVHFKSPEQFRNCFSQSENRISFAIAGIDDAAAAPGLSASIDRGLTRWCGGWGWTAA